MSAGRRKRLISCALLGALLAGCGTGSDPESGASNAFVPEPHRAVPREPGRLAAALRETTAALRASIDEWLAEGSSARERPPREVALQALYQQRIHVLLSERPRLARDTLARLRGAVAAEARDTIAARRALGRITPPTRRTRFRTGRALPPGLLLRHYRRAQRRFDVDWEVLAAVNFVESAFNRLRSDSSAGAQGPMQFIPQTWRAYGMGGDVHEPRDAIMGAANYLRASGAPRDYRSALHAYNHSSSYVDAVLRYTRRMRRDVRSYYAYYSWQVFVRTPSGLRRITGPGLRTGDPDREG